MPRFTTDFEAGHGEAETYRRSVFADVVAENHKVVVVVVSAETVLHTLEVAAARRGSVLHAGADFPTVGKFRHLEVFNRGVFCVFPRLVGEVGLYHEAVAPLVVDTGSV